MPLGIPGKLHDWLQIIGLFGVLAGLVFVGLQLRQDRRVAVANAVDAVAGDLVEWAQLVTDNSEVWRKGLAGEPLSESEAMEFDAMARAWDTRQYANWIRAVQGISPSPPERFVRQTAVEVHAYPGLRSFWQQREAYFLQVSQAPSEFMLQVGEELALLDRESLVE